MRFLAIVRFTLEEAARRRVLLAMLICGGAFLVLYAVGFHFLVRDLAGEKGAMATLTRQFVVNMFTVAGLFAVNFLMVMSAVLLPVDTLSGEITTGVLQTVAARPLHRAEIVLGKWLGHLLVVWGYLLALASGVLATAWLTAHRAPPNVPGALGCLALEAAVLVSLSIAGGARLSTVTNGVLAFGMFGFAFLGGWVEQIGSLVNNDATRNIGTITSLVMPTESLWRLAAHLLQPPFLAQMRMSPFAMGPVPSVAMVVWAVLWVGVALVSAVRGFHRRPL